MHTVVIQCFSNTSATFDGNHHEQWLVPSIETTKMVPRSHNIVYCINKRCLLILNVISNVMVQNDLKCIHLWFFYIDFQTP